MNGNTSAAIVLLVGTVIAAVDRLTWLWVKDQDERGGAA